MCRQPKEWADSVEKSRWGKSEKSQVDISTTIGKLKICHLNNLRNGDGSSLGRELHVVIRLAAHNTPSTTTLQSAKVDMDNQELSYVWSDMSHLIRSQVQVAAREARLPGRPHCQDNPAAGQAATRLLPS